jgi:hypothetical protein
MENGKSLKRTEREHGPKECECGHIREGLLEKLTLVQHVCEGHRVYSNEAKILEIKNNRYRRYMESAHVT